MVDKLVALHQAENAYRETVSIKMYTWIECVRVCVLETDNTSQYKAAAFMRALKIEPALTITKATTQRNA